ERRHHRALFTLHQTIDDAFERILAELLAAHARGVEVGMAVLAALENALLEEPLHRRLHGVQRDAAPATERVVHLLGVGLADLPQVLEHRGLELAEHGLSCAKHPGRMCAIKYRWSIGSRRLVCLSHLRAPACAAHARAVLRPR